MIEFLSLFFFSAQNPDPSPDCYSIRTGFVPYRAESTLSVPGFAAASLSLRSAGSVAQPVGVGAGATVSRSRRIRFGFWRV